MEIYKIMHGEKKITPLILFDFYHPNIKSYKLNMLKFHQEAKENKKQKSHNTVWKEK